MPCVCQPVLSCCGMASDLCAGEDTGGSLIAEALAQYRPRHPERTVFYQLFEDQFDSYVRAYEQRFEPRSGPLRPVVVRSVEEFLSCGRLEGGFARLRCPKCHAEHLLAFSCCQRGICSSCQAKRGALFAERLTDAILAPVPHRHWTFSIPRVLRGLVERDRKLLGLLSQAAYASLLKTFQALSDRKDVRPRAVSLRSKRLASVRGIGIRTPKQSFPMAFSLPKVSFFPCLRHLGSDRCQARDPFESRAPPRARAFSL